MGSSPESSIAIEAIGRAHDLIAAGDATNDLARLSALALTSISSDARASV